MSKSESSADKKSEKKIDKSLCDWSKRELRDHFEQLQTLVESPRYACLKCGRAANAKKWLCKAKALD